MLSYNCQKEINKLHKRKGYKAMINFKKTLSINDIALSIKKMLTILYNIIIVITAAGKHMLECRTINSERFAL